MLYINNHTDGTIAGAQLCGQQVPSTMPCEQMQQFNMNVVTEMDQLSPSQQEQYLQYVQYMQQMQQYYTMQGMQSPSSQSMHIQQQLQQWNQMNAAQQYQYYQQLQQYQQYQQQLQSQQCQQQMANARAQSAGAQTPSAFPTLYNYSSERSYAANNDHVRSRTASPATMLHYVQEFQSNAVTKHIVSNQDGGDSNEHGPRLQTTDHQTTRMVPFISIDLHRFSFRHKVLSTNSDSIPFHSHNAIPRSVHSISHFVPISYPHSISQFIGRVLLSFDNGSNGTNDPDGAFQVFAQCQCLGMGPNGRPAISCSATGHNVKIEYP